MLLLLLIQAPASSAPQAPPSVPPRPSQRATNDAFVAASKKCVADYNDAKPLRARFIDLMRPIRIMGSECQQKQDAVKATQRRVDAAKKQLVAEGVTGPGIEAVLFTQGLPTGILPGTETARLAVEYKNASSALDAAIKAEADCNRQLNEAEKKSGANVAGRDLEAAMAKLKSDQNAVRQIVDEAHVADKKAGRTPTNFVDPRVPGAAEYKACLSASLRVSEADFK